MKNLITFGVMGFVAINSLYFLVPTKAMASSAYVPQTTLEYIAYLQGVVDALKAQSLANSSSDVHVSTPSVASSVTLKAELETKSGTSAYAWFEYGQGSLDSKTTRVRVTKKRTDDSYEHDVVLKNLKAGTYSYRAVFERDGKKYYGNINTVTVGDTNGGYSLTSGGLTTSNSRGSLSLSKTAVTAGEYFEVDWTVPSSKANSSNWIGMYTRSADNDEYVSWKYLSDKTSGTVRFYLKERGTYEFRLFYNNSYKDEVTSRSLTVNRK